MTEMGQIDDPGPSLRVAVIGGGISGLAAAHRLLTAGSGPSRPRWAVTLIEKAPRLGGKVITEHADGFLFEGGPDSFIAGKETVLQLARELGIGDRVISSRPESRGASVWSQGRLHPVPEGLLLMAPSRLSPVIRSSLLSWKGKLRVLADLVIPRGASDREESLEAFVTRRLGREMLERIAEPLIASIHAAEPSTMSLAASFPRFLDMEREHRSLILAARSASLRPGASSPAGGDGPSHFASFRRGMGELPAALVEALPGADIRTGRAVTHLTEDRIRPGETHKGFRLTLDDGSEIRVGGVILATPAEESAALLSGVAPAAASAVAGIRQVATATVTLAYRVGDLPGLSGSGFVVPSIERRRIRGVSYLSRKWEGRVPDSRFELLRAFIGGSDGQELALGDEEAMLTVVREELAEILGLTAPPVMARTRRWAGGLHQYTLGHLDRMARIDSEVAAHPGLALAGAAFYGIGLNECVQSGRRAADGVRAALAKAGTTKAAGLLEMRAGGGD